MTWGTFPSGQETTWGPPNGGIPPDIMQPPPAAGYVIARDERDQPIFEPRWASVPTTTFTYTHGGRVVGNPTNPFIALPRGPTPPGQSQGPPYLFLPQQQIASQFPHLTPAPAPAAGSSPDPSTAPGGPSAPTPAGPHRPEASTATPCAGPAAPSQTQAPTAVPSAGAGAFPGMPPPQMVYAVPGMEIFTTLDAQGNLQVSLPGPHSAANLPQGFLHLARPS
ncbi:predicted protein [Histoplasma capsulatum G186AR]|uniref:Uncharacterized protein n=1 Tax=Ajellomyces capsulatus (strain G186AR / H82 / ATCC MYA-2454 / RMSCC 2432) TaxID=447093 RepID=C0NXQ8_AJECG|nr:uncharacterized protein HCBG_07702 [Histoplasma capsulatum G186AR]EEH03576.1 predicted protein [Histoplasma capsulatum G186AR]